MAAVQSLGCPGAFEVVPNCYTPASSARPLLLCDLIAALDKLDSADVPWHVARGLPLELQLGDSIVMSAKEMEGNRYWQEFYKYSTGCNGKLKLHRVRMDAPKGSPVILTDEQFLYAIQRHNLLLCRNKVKKLRHKLLKHMGSKKRVSLCLICKEPFQYYADVQLARKSSTRSRQSTRPRCERQSQYTRNSTRSSAVCSL